VQQVSGGSESSVSAAESGVAAFARRHSLSPKETEVLGLIMQRKSNREIQQALGYKSEQVAKNCLRHIFMKTGAKSRLKLYGQVEELINLVERKRINNRLEFFAQHRSTFQEYLNSEEEFRQFMQHRQEFLTFKHRRDLMRANMGLATA
jgi:DNA-binding CsgD family transcriptional regulator